MVALTLEWSQPSKATSKATAPQPLQSLPSGIPTSRKVSADQRHCSSGFMMVRPLQRSLLFRVLGFLDREWSPACLPLPPRRNRPGDREKALAVLLPLVQVEGPVAPDLYCMCGRIYKDMFFSSGFQDAGHREQAYHW